MKKILAAFLMMPMIAFSQTKQSDAKYIEALCMSVADLDELLKNFEEIPFVRGTSYREDGRVASVSSLVVFMNSKTKSWTIVERTTEKLYCVIAVGKDMEPVPQDIINNIENIRKKSKS